MGALSRRFARRVIDRDLLDLKLHRVAALARDLDRLERSAVAQHRVADLLGLAQPRTENVLPTTRLNGRYHLL